MAQLDPNIILRGFNPPPLEDPLENAAKAYTLKSHIMQAQNQERQFKMQDAFQKAQASLPADTPLDQRINAAIPYLGPKDIIQHAGNLETRRAQIQATAEQKAAQLAQSAQNNALMHEVRMSRLTTDQDRAAETARHNRAQEEIAQQSQALNAELRRIGFGIQKQGLDLRRDMAAQGNRPPPGYRWTPQGDLERIPGGPADEKAGLAGQKEQLRQQGAVKRADIVINKVDEALAKTGFWTTGLIGDLRGTLPGRLTGSGAYDLEKTLDTVKANIGFKELQEMKEASPTGGALGQIAVRELELLQAVVASLEKGQDESVLRENLTQVKTHFENWKKAVQKANAQQSQNPDQGSKSGWKDL